MLVVVAMMVGAIVPVQTAINTRLRQSVGSPIGATFLSFILAVAASCVIALFATRTLVPDLALAASEPWWVWLGGFMGVMFIAGNIVLFPELGAVQTTILPILGQVLMGLLIDATGLFRYPQTPVGPLRLLGALIVLLGIAMVLEVGRGARLHGTASGARAWLLRGFGVLMGMGSATQTAVNGYLGKVLHSPIQAGQISLAVGLILLFAMVLLIPAPRRAVASGVAPGPWWMWLGGVLGALFVFGGASLSPLLGAGTTVIGSLVGMIICGQVLESLGIGGGTKGFPSPFRLTGLAVVLVGVAMVRLL
ncbi:DMT family transporter [Corynebacterium sp. NML180780]|uniref:DMT family transporter n=1 Tax=Corynebacterium sp. NML180780 TaxID=2598459 RepID=UPI001195A5F4|nr:DMT family transporter [Corynebacterium sp. NML180780]TVX75968.1 DMT family transporter [Corynebacterium sp. NML180780]